MINRLIVDNIIETANEHIVDVVSDFVSLKKRGSGYVGCCPFHNEKTPSFHVTPSRGIYKCFGCSKGGNALNFVMEYDHLTFVEALRYLGNKFNIDVPDEEETPEMVQARSERESMMAVMTYAKESFIQNLWETEEGESVALPYFRHRGFRDDIIRKFELGYSLDRRDAFTTQALAHGFKQIYLEKTGFTISGDNGYRSDRFHGRVMFPIHSVSGKVIAFGGRVMQTNGKVAKYFNSPENELYHKSNVLYGIYQAKNEINRLDMCYLVEGYTDVISMHQSGIVNVVASSGTSLTDGQIALIKRYTNNITVLYDGDKAGVKASERGINMILEQGMNVKVVFLPDGDDPDSFARKHNADEYREYINSHQTDFIKFKATVLMDDAKNDPLKKSALINNIVSTIAVVQDKVLRDIYIRECASIMQMSEQTLFDVLRDKLVNDAIKRRDEIERQRQQHDRYEERTAKEANELYVDPNSQTPVAANTTPQPVAQPAKNSFANEERTLLRYFVKYIDKILFQGTEYQTTVGEYIVSMLATDEYVSSDNIFNKIIQYYIDIEDKTSISPKTFINVADAEISQMAAQLIEDKYELSKMYRDPQYSKTHTTVTPEEKMLDTLIPRIMNEINIKKVINKIQELTSELQKEEAQNPESERIMQLVEEIGKWNSIKCDLSKVVGERAVCNV